MTRTRPTWAQRLLGLFVLWQLVFLLFSNLRFLLGESPATEALSPALKGMDRACARWMELTTQRQGWGQYSPSVTRQSVFTAVELVWYGGPEPRRVEVRSDFEPADPNGFFLRTPDQARLLTCEEKYNWQMWGWNARAIAAEPARYRRQMAAHLNGIAPALRAFLSWRARQAFPERPVPDELILRARIYATPPPDRVPWGYGPPEDLPLARWRPAGPGAGLEMYDPTGNPPAYVPLAEVRA